MVLRLHPKLNWGKGPHCPSMNMSADGSNCRKRRKVTVEETTLGYPAGVVARTPVLARAVSHCVSKGGTTAQKKSTRRTAADRELHGCKEQFHTSALARTHASTMSCDNAHIHMPNTQYAATQAWICSCHSLLSRSCLQISHIQLKQSSSRSATCTP